MSKHTTPHPARIRRIVGCMTGTSLDALDAALVTVTGDGLDITTQIERTITSPLNQLEKLLRPLTQQKRLPAEKFANYAFMLAMHHVAAIKKLLKDEKVDLIAVHGQTIFHRPPLSWQLIDPMPIAHHLNTPVVYNLRGADLAMGGYGAPITPISDFVMFRSSKQTRCVINLGGFINFTWLPRSNRAGNDALGLIRAGDICVCNQLLNMIARRWFRKPYDADGRRAMQGSVNDDAFDFLMMMLDAQAADNRSLGTGDEATDWAKAFQHSCSPDDLARTACAAIAQTVARHSGEADCVILAGGGVHNEALVTELRARLNNAVLADELHVPASHREAVAMAVLGALAEDRVPITLSQVTNVEQSPCAGAWVYP